MPLFNWPYTNLHNLNLDWIIKKIKNVETAETNTAASEEAAAGSAASAAESEANAAESETNAAASATAAGNYYNNIRENVSTLVTGWLDEHITPTTPPVDDTLTIHGAAADAKKTGDQITDLKNAIQMLPQSVTYMDGFYVDNGGFVGARTNSRIALLDVSTLESDIISVKISGNNITRVLYTTTSIEDVTAGTSGFYSDFQNATELNIPKEVYGGYNTIIICINFSFLPYATVTAYTKIDFQKMNEGVNALVNFPVLRNGSRGNPANANAIATRYIVPVKNILDISVGLKNVTLPSGYQFEYSYCAYSVEYGNPADSNYNQYIIEEKDPYIKTPDYKTNITLPTGTKGVALTAYMSKISDGTRTPLRTENVGNDAIQLTFLYGYQNIDTISKREIVNTSVNRKLVNAQHAQHRWNVTPTPSLTILHFSDLHADTDAMNRIIEDSEEMENIDDIICTGDMVANTSTQISSWWIPRVLTCIGNHDTASYNSETGYNWTALSMSDRSSYYIDPFIGDWGSLVYHTAGTSYYYKDYASQKVRLIVMDAMLYTDNGTEATVQTSWLSYLLSDAITNGMHVLIAIHAPHGGATVENCSFSKYGQGTMPTETDCTTPQTVIDTVASAITNGLHFIGYLVGHTHQDNVWDAEGDGTQLMYCVTCAIVSQTAQWVNSDQNRSTSEDAYNLVTIDTDHTLIKLVRGGGADIDDHMRTRKAICFNYSTGEKVGEVL